MDCFVASLPCANASRLSQAMTEKASIDDDVGVSRIVVKAAWPKLFELAHVCASPTCMVEPKRIPLRRFRPDGSSQDAQRVPALTRPAAPRDRFVAGNKSRCFVRPPGQMTEQIHRQRKDHGRGSLPGNVVQRREVAQLHRLWLPRKRSACLDELLG